MLARAPPRPCSTGGDAVAGSKESTRPWTPVGGVGLAKGAARCPGPRAGVRLVAARAPGRRATTTTVVAAATGERRTAGPGPEAASAEAANGSSSVVAGTVLAC